MGQSRISSWVIPRCANAFQGKIQPGPFPTINSQFPLRPWSYALSPDRVGSITPVPVSVVGTKNHRLSDHLSRLSIKCLGTGLPRFSSACIAYTVREWDECLALSIVRLPSRIRLMVVIAKAYYLIVSVGKR
jgi:hypothetical protein